MPGKNGKNGKKVVSVEELKKDYQQRYDKLVEDWENIDKLELDDKDKKNGNSLDDIKDENRIVEFEKAVNLFVEAWKYNKELGEDFYPFYEKLASLCADRMLSLNGKFDEKKFNTQNQGDFEYILYHSLKERSNETAMIRLMIFDRIKSSFVDEVEKSIKAGKDQGNFRETKSYISGFINAYAGFNSPFTEFPKTAKQIREKIYEYVLSTFDKGTNLKFEDLNKTKLCVDMCKSMFGEKIYNEALNSRKQIREKIYEYTLSTFTKEVQTLIEKDTDLKFKDLNKTKLCEEMCKSMFGEKTYKEALNSRNLPNVIKKGTDDEIEKSEKERENAENARRKELENDKNLGVVCHYLYNNRETFFKTADKKLIILFAPLRPYLRVIQLEDEAQKKKESNRDVEKNQKINNNHINDNRINTNRINEEEDQKVVNVQNEKQKEEPKGTEVKNEDLKVTEVKNDINDNQINTNQINEAEDKKEKLKVTEVQNKKPKAVEVKNEDLKVTEVQNENLNKDLKVVDVENMHKMTEEELLEKLKERQNYISNYEKYQKNIQRYQELEVKIKNYTNELQKQNAIRETFAKNIQKIFNVLDRLEATGRPETSTQYKFMLDNLRKMRENGTYEWMGKHDPEQWNELTMSSIDNLLERTLDSVIVYKNKKMGESSSRRTGNVGGVRFTAASEAIDIIMDLQSSLRDARVLLSRVPKKEYESWKNEYIRLGAEKSDFIADYITYSDAEKKAKYETEVTVLNNEMKKRKRQSLMEESPQELLDRYTSISKELKKRTIYVEVYDSLKELDQLSDRVGEKITFRDECKKLEKDFLSTKFQLDKLKAQFENTGLPNSSEQYSFMMKALTTFTDNPNWTNNPWVWNFSLLKSQLFNALDLTKVYRDNKVERGGWISTGMERGSTRIKLAGEAIGVMIKLRNQLEKLEEAKEKYDGIDIINSKYGILSADNLNTTKELLENKRKAILATYGEYNDVAKRTKYGSEIPKLKNDAKEIKKVVEKRKIQLKSNVSSSKKKINIEKKNIINDKKNNEFNIDTSSEPKKKASVKGGF